jgi:hypothetical protein
MSRFLPRLSESPRLYGWTFAIMYFGGAATVFSQFGVQGENAWIGGLGVVTMFLGVIVIVLGMLTDM